MTTVIRIFFAVALVASLVGGLAECQPCEDPSQLFCQRSVGADVNRAG